MSKKYLFSLTITPIQSFIAQAKSTKDFYSGSQIISELIQELLTKFPNQEDIIFPARRSVVSNKIIAKIDIEEQEKLIEALQTSIKSFLSLTALCNGVSLQCDSKETQQLQDVFQLFYASVEINNNYKKSYIEVEKNLAIVKNLRRFNQISSKNICYVCGEREAFCRDKDSRYRCTLCYLKSKYDNSSYLSTAGIASLDWQDGLDTSAYKQNFKSFDEALFFEENLEEKYLKKHNHFKSKNIKSIKEELKKLSEEKPSRQYALINFDGDSVGKILSDGLDDIELELFHREFSKKLSNFSEQVKNIISSEKGRVVYSGGDDFLGFVNLYYLDEVLEEIKKSFDSIVNVYGIKISYSTSVVIAHYKAPLHKIIEYSRALLEDTKNKYSSKDSLVKGGIGIEVYSTTSRLSRFIGERKEFVQLKYFRGKKVNLYQLEKLFFFAKEEMDYHEYLTILKMMKIELKRFFLRREIGFSEIDIGHIQSLLLSQVNQDNSIDLDNFFGFFKTVEQLSKDSNE